MIVLEATQLNVKIGQQTLCRNLQFTLKAGEIWGLLGQNGSGKSTLLSTLGGLNPTSEGKVLLYGKQLKQYSIKQIAQKLGFLFQEVNTAFAQSVWDYCLTGRYPHLNYFKKETQADKAIVKASLQKMELMHLANRAITTLSGGEKRRLSIAAILAQRPAIYLLDEPTNHLDLKHQTQMMLHFNKLAMTEGAAILMALHDINLVQRFCHFVILLLKNGEILQGPLPDILTQKNVESLYQLPMRKIEHNDMVYWMPMPK